MRLSILAGRLCAASLIAVASLVIVVRSNANIFDKIIIHSEAQLWNGYSRDRDSARQFDIQRRRELMQKQRSEKERQVWEECIKQLESNAEPPELHRAAALNAVGDLTSLLDAGIPVHSKDRANFWTPLHYAAYFGSADTGRQLLVVHSHRFCR